MTDYKVVLTHIAEALVDHPEQVSVITKEKNEDHIVLELSVSPDDMGKVIGKNGKIAKAIRTVLKAVANAEGDRVVVDIR